MFCSRKVANIIKNLYGIYRDEKKDSRVLIGLTSTYYKKFLQLKLCFQKILLVSQYLILSTCARNMLIYMSTRLGMFDNMQVLECKQTRELNSRGRCLETKPGLHDNTKSASTKSTSTLCVTCKLSAAGAGAKVVRGKARR